MEIQTFHNTIKPEMVEARIKENKALFGSNEVTTKIAYEFLRSRPRGYTGQIGNNLKIELRRLPISQYWRYRHD